MAVHNISYSKDIISRSYILQNPCKKREKIRKGKMRNCAQKPVKPETHMNGSVPHFQMAPHAA